MTGRRALLPAPLLALLLASNLAFGQDAAVLDVKVGGHASRRLGPAELAALPQTEIVEARSLSGTAGTQGEQVRWRGVLLRDVLDAAGMQSLDKRALRRSSVVARASDDYAVVFSWGELYNARLGDNVLVVTSSDGKPLPPTEGPYALRSLSDTKSGPRHVKWLRRLEVSTVAQ
jgi:DMSO/TMAO reductase YedYZ molybdopterin-dependent catalytic subunit